MEDTFYYVLSEPMTDALYESGTIANDINDVVGDWPKHVIHIAKECEACDFATKNHHTMIVDGEGKIQWHWYRGAGNWKPGGARTTRTMHNPKLQFLWRYDAYVASMERSN